MAESTPLLYRYGLEQGRLRTVDFVPQDGDFAYILGSEYGGVEDVVEDDRVEISQSLDLTDIDLIRIAAGFLQPKTMPFFRNVAGHFEGDPPAWVYTARLKRSEVLHRVHPTALAGAHEPYTLDPGMDLKIKVDGGSEQDISFGAGGIFSAAQMVAIINSSLTDAVASAAGDIEDQYLVLTANSIGRYVSPGVLASLQITGGSAFRGLRLNLGKLKRLLSGSDVCTLTHATGIAYIPGAAFAPADIGCALQLSNSESVNNGPFIIDSLPGPTNEYAVLSPAPGADEGPRNFLSATKFDGIYETRTFYGADDLSAIVALDADFVASDAGLHLEISGCTTHPANNGTNYIESVQSPTLAILKHPILEEPVGFDAKLYGAAWKMSILVDDAVQFSTLGQRGKKVLTNDVAVNVSKLSGTHKLAFRLELVALTS